MSVGRRHAVFLVLLAAISMAVAVAADPTTPNDELSNSTMNASNEKIQLSCTIPKRVPAGQKIPLKMTLSNGESSNLGIGEYDSWPKKNCVITILDAKKQVCLPNQEGERKLGGPGRIFTGAIVTLAPGGSKTWTLDLQGLFSLQPGKYTISVNYDAFSYETLKKYSITLNDIPFTVTAASGQ